MQTAAGFDVVLPMDTNTNSVLTPAMNIFTAMLPANGN